MSGCLCVCVCVSGAPLSPRSPAVQRRSAVQAFPVSDPPARRRNSLLFLRVFVSGRGLLSGLFSPSLRAGSAVPHGVSSGLKLPKEPGAVLRRADEGPCPRSGLRGGGCALSPGFLLLWSSAPLRMGESHRVPAGVCAWKLLLGEEDTFKHLLFLRGECGVRESGGSVQSGRNVTLSQRQVKPELFTA